MEKIRAIQLNTTILAIETSQYYNNRSLINNSTLDDYKLI